jgi:hypothetical protein
MASLAPVTWAHISIDAPQTFLTLQPQAAAGGHASGSAHEYGAGPLAADPGSPSSYLMRSTSTLIAPKIASPGFLSNGLHPEGPAALMLLRDTEGPHAHPHMLGFQPMMLAGAQAGNWMFGGPLGLQAAPQVGPCARSCCCCLR